ncbi:MAG: TetR/AcrR family transcriptional regulator [Hyphomicrobiales bacterium]
MPKKIMQNRNELRIAMIDTAERIIEQDGVEALTARKLAHEMGIAVGTTYNFFKQMDDLISEVSTRTLSALAAEIEAAENAGEDIEAQLTTYADAYITFVTNNPKRWAALFAGAIDTDSEVQNRNAEQVLRLFNALERVFAPIAKQIPNFDPAKSARALWAAVHGVLTLASTGRIESIGLGDARETVRLLIHFHVAGINAQL